MGKLANRPAKDVVHDVSVVPVIGFSAGGSETNVTPERTAIVVRDMIPEVKGRKPRKKAPPQPTIVHNTVQNSGAVKRHAASEGLARVLPNTCEESRCKCK